MRRRYYGRYKRGKKLPVTFWLIILAIGLIYSYPWVLLVVIALFIAAGVIKYEKNKRREKEYYTYEESVKEINHKSMDLTELPYQKKASQITEAEMNFYRVLEQAVAGRFDIQRQVLVSTLVDTISENFKDYKTGREFNPDRSKIDRKTIDFVLFNREDLSPYLAIELDDSSHNREDRMERDHFVEGVLSGTGIRLVRVKASYSYNLETLDMILNL